MRANFHGVETQIWKGFRLLGWDIALYIAGFKVGEK